MKSEVTRRDFPPEYFEIVVWAPQEIDEHRIAGSSSFCEWPRQFGVISGYATTGEVWPEQANQEADRRLQERLRELSNWVRRVEVSSPDRTHCEPSWAAALPWETLCDLGQEFLQCALYYVKDDAMYVSFCDVRRQLVPMGSFRTRVQTNR